MFFQNLSATTKQSILVFMRDHPMATIATIDAHALKPESALIAFAEYENFVLLFETFQESRKFDNLRANNAVSLVIGWDTAHHVTLQYEGKATPVPAAKKEAQIQYFLQKDTPCTEKFLRDERVRLYTVAPTWIRYSDYTGKEPAITEITF